MLPDSLFSRYQRQVSLPEIGEQGQQSLLCAHVLVIGCGGLGTAASLYLAASGVGRIVLVDDDVVDVSNLQRQVAYRQSDIDKNKAESLARQIEQLNSNVQVRSIKYRLSDEQMGLEVMLADIVLDCSDNFKTRHQVNLSCYQQKTTLISGSAIGWNGQFSIFDFSSEAPCYRCLVPFDEVQQSNKCSEQGVVGPLVGILGNYQALAAIQKLAVGQFMVKTNQLHVFDGITMLWRMIDITPDAECEVCGEHACYRG